MITAAQWLRLEVEMYRRTGWPTECVLWPQGDDGYGYGMLRFAGAANRAHRVGWFIWHGEWPKQTLDHVKARGCHSKSCFNVTHLEDVPNSENVRRQAPYNYQLKITHCPQGHPYSGANLYTFPDGRRDCRACRAASRARYQEGQRA